MHTSIILADSARDFFLTSNMNSFLGSLLISIVTITASGVISCLQLLIWALRQHGTYQEQRAATPGEIIRDLERLINGEGNISFRTFDSTALEGWEDLTEYQSQGFKPHGPIVCLIDISGDETLLVRCGMSAVEWSGLAKLHNN